MFGFIILLLLCSVAANIQNGSYIIKQASVLCPPSKPDFCIGVSTGGDAYPISYQPLQIKQRSTNIMKETDTKLRWDIWNTGIMFTNSKWNITLPMFIDKHALGTRAVVSASGEAIVSNTSIISSINSILCLSIMKCDPNQEGYCNPFSEQRVQTTQEIKKGAYLRFKPCSKDHVSQTFSLDPYCAVGCNKTQSDGICDVACDVAACFFDFNDCNGTSNSSVSPTVDPPTTMAPTFAPPAITAGPTIAPSTHPTASPTPEPLYTLNPTDIPVPGPGSLTNNPSATPTIGARLRAPSKTPTNAPTKGPTTFPSVEQQIIMGVLIPILLILMCVLIWRMYVRTFKENKPSGAPTTTAATSSTTAPPPASNSTPQDPPPLPGPAGC